MFKVTHPISISRESVYQFLTDKRKVILKLKLQLHPFMGCEHEAATRQGQSFINRLQDRVLTSQPFLHKLQVRVPLC